MGRGDELWRKALKFYHISLGVAGSHIELSVMECQGERPEIVADIPHLFAVLAESNGGHSTRDPGHGSCSFKAWQKSCEGTLT